MKKASLIALAICTYWITRVIAAPAPAPELISVTIDELQSMEALQLERQDWGKVLEEHAARVDLSGIE